MSTDELLAETLRLTRVDRARVAEELLSSLKESDEDAALWYDECSGVIRFPNVRDPAEQHRESEPDHTLIEPLRTGPKPQATILVHRQVDINCQVPAGQHVSMP